MKEKSLRLLCFLSAASLLPLLVSGCMSLFSQQPYVAVKYYDLDSPPQRELKNIQLKFVSFDSTEPVKYKMVYHDNNSEVVVDDYNKWIQPPSLLLTRYLQSSFKQQSISSGKVSKLTISGDIFMFKIDLKNNMVSLGVSYVIQSSSDNMLKVLMRNSSIFNCKLKKQSPQEFVSAMSNCAGQLTASIEKSIHEVQEHKLSKEKNTNSDKKKK